MIGQHIRLSWSPNSFGNSTSGQVWAVRVRKFDVYPARVVLICPEKGGLKIFAPLPNSFKKLLGVCADKLGFLPYKILTEWGTQIDCIEEIDDDDRLVVVSSMTEWEKFLSSLNY
ncbi:RAC-alpha serine/threonine-protein kinase [Ancistrocladus abbreviatus]